MLKQIVEGNQILKSIEYGSGWLNHPAVKMWWDYCENLRMYINAMIKEAKARGLNTSAQFHTVKPEKPPPWLGVDVLHKSHQMALMRKTPDYYKFDVEDVYHNLGYVWPSDFPHQHIDKLAPSEACRAISDRQKNMKHCIAILKSGKRKDQACGNGVYDGNDYCRVHRRRELN